MVRKFGLGNCLGFFHLLQPTPPTGPPQVRHRVSLGFPALRCKKNSLRFFGLLEQFAAVPPTHNRQVEGSNPSGPTILLFL